MSTTTLVDRAAALLDRGPSRRSFLVRAAVVGSALTLSPLRYLLRPGTAYAAVCGADASCGAGYAVFCCTVNNGVNRCPPGSLVGGWWKSDNSGFCCGSARYYIDCHSFCSCGCEGGNNFCGEGCHNCSCGCGPGDQCDQRKVCCNNFRYGQCNQGISCTGPVWCRVVTCTPPWKVPAWNCSTTSATDQRTNDHGAPCLLDCTPIGTKYTELGGPGSPLGEATTGELTPPDGAGRYVHYTDASIYWSGATGAHEVRGSVRRRWEALGWELGPLGYPVTDESPTPDGVGRYNHFAGGSIYWHPALGAFSVRGPIRQKWEQLRWEAGPLGYPVTDQLAAADDQGSYNHFAGGSIYSHPDTGVHAVWGSIREKWAELGLEQSTLGYPLTDERPTPDGVGRYNHFSSGSIYWHPDIGAHAVEGVIRQRWELLGWELGPLGYPVTDQRTVPGGGSYNDFVGSGTPSAPAASIYAAAATGAHSVTGPVRVAWLEHGGPTGTLGFPTGEPYQDADGLTRSDFQGGSISYDPSTGATVVTQGGR